MVFFFASCLLRCFYKSCWFWTYFFVFLVFRCIRSCPVYRKVNWFAFFFFLFSRLLLFEMQSMHLDHTLSLQPSSVHSDSPTRYPRRLLMVRWSHLKVANFQIEPPSLSRDLTSPFY